MYLTEICMVQADQLAFNKTVVLIKYLHLCIILKLVYTKWCIPTIGCLVVLYG